MPMNANPIPPTALITAKSGGVRQTVSRTDERQSEVALRHDGACPDRIVERGGQKSDHGGIYASHQRLRCDSSAEHIPKRQRAFGRLPFVEPLLRTHSDRVKISRRIISLFRNRVLATTWGERTPCTASTYRAASLRA